MEHLVRAGALLLAVLIVVFVVPRAMPIPTFLEDYGFYPKNSEKNAEEWSGLPIQYADSSICNDCHQDKRGIWEKSEHRTVSCETCHGPGQPHMDKRASLTVDTSREFCGLCHARVLARPSDFPQVDLDEHAGQAACITCHNPHDPQVATLPKIPHALEGRSDCLLCHNTGGIEPFPQDHEERSQDTCLNCHKNK
jgi:hypothetical protein